MTMNFCHKRALNSLVVCYSFRVGTRLYLENFDFLPVQVFTSESGELEKKTSQPRYPTKKDFYNNITYI